MSGPQTKIRRFDNLDALRGHGGRGRRTSAHGRLDSSLEVDDEGGVVGGPLAPPGVARSGESRQQVRVHEGLIDPEAIAAIG